MIAGPVNASRNESAPADQARLPTHERKYISPELHIESAVSGFRLVAKAWPGTAARNPRAVLASSGPGLAHIMFRYGTLLREFAPRQRTRR